MLSSLRDEHREFFKSLGTTAEATMKEIVSNSTELTNIIGRRLVNEWAKRANAVSGHGRIQWASSPVRWGAMDWSESKTHHRSPNRTAQSRGAGSYTETHDVSRIQKIETDENGAFAVDKLTMGSYEIDVETPGKPRTTKSIVLLNHESQAELNDHFRQRLSSGRVTDSAGDPVHNAVIKAVKRYGTQEENRTGLRPTYH
ncbi:MAG: hypothetical protein U0936_25300 [Planctomycetaceae bacterium]